MIRPDRRPGPRNPAGPDVSKDRARWVGDFTSWSAMADRFETTLTWSPHHGEIATLRGDGVHLVIYAHRTGAGNHRPRIRNVRSPDRRLAREIVQALGIHIRIPL